MTSDQVVQVVTTALGLLATLVAVWLTWFLTNRSEARRLRFEDDRRWQADRFRVLSAYVAAVATVDRSLDSALSAYREYGAAVERLVDRGAMTEDLAQFQLDQMSKWIGLGTRPAEDADRLLGELRLLLDGPCVDAAISTGVSYVNASNALAAMEDFEVVEERLVIAREDYQRLIDEARAVLVPRHGVNHRSPW